MAYTPTTALQQVEALYIGYFGRAGEPGGVQYWVDQIQAGRTFAQVAAAFSVQAEAKGQHPFLANPDIVSPDAFVESLYQQIYGRASDATGKAYWVAQATAAAQNPFAIGLLVAQFISGAQGDDILVITNKVAAAEYFTGKLASAGIQGTDAQGQVTPTVDNAATDIIKGVTKDQSSVTAANTKSDAFASTGGTPPSTDPIVFTNVVGEVKTGTTGADTFSAVVDGATQANGTFNTGDSANGQGGIDTFNLLVANTGTLPAGATTSAIEIVNITYADGKNLGALTSAPFTGIQQLWQVDNDVTTNDFQNVTVATGVTAGFRSNGTVDVAGKTVTAATGTQTDIAVAFDNVLTGSAVTFVGAGLTNASISGAAKAAATVTVNGVANITDLKIGITNNTTLDLVTFTNTKNVDASTSTGNFTTNLATATWANLEKYTGGTGGETVTFDLADGKAVTIDMKSGNDIVKIVEGAAATTNAASTIALGDGKDTLDVDVLQNIADATQANFQAGIITVSDFKVGDDTLDIKGLTGDRALSTTELANISGATSLFAAVTAAAAALGANAAGTFNYGGSAYVFQNDAQAAFDAGDGLIKITGLDVTQLTSSSYLVG